MEKEPNTNALLIAAKDSEISILKNRISELETALKSIDPSHYLLLLTESKLSLENVHGQLEELTPSGRKLNHITKSRPNLRKPKYTPDLDKELNRNTEELLQKASESKNVAESYPVDPEAEFKKKINMIGGVNPLMGLLNPAAMLGGLKKTTSPHNVILPNSNISPNHNNNKQSSSTTLIPESKALSKECSITKESLHAQESTSVKNNKPTSDYCNTHLVQALTAPISSSTPNSPFKPAQIGKTPASSSPITPALSINSTNSFSRQTCINPVSPSPPLGKGPVKISKTTSSSSSGSLSPTTSRSGTPPVELILNLSAKSEKICNEKENEKKEDDDDELRYWIAKKSGETSLVNDKSKNLQSLLKDGIVLCKLLNATGISPTIKPNTGKFTFNHMENINNFLNRAESEYGLTKSLKFEPNDLYENANMAKVMTHLRALRDHVRAQHPDT